MESRNMQYIQNIIFGSPFLGKETPNFRRAFVSVADFATRDRV